MRRLLNTLFILNEEAYLALENENVVVKQDEEILGQVPLLNLENILYFGYKGASPALMGECAKRKIGLCFLSRHGRFLARVCGMNPGNVLLRKKQYLLSENYEESCQIARNFIAGKIFNARTVIERMKRDHPLNIDKNKFDDLILSNKQDFEFKSRQKRPPIGKVNALLSFAYTILAHDCASVLEAVGLDAYVGFFHSDRPGRPSLALDLMEELRAIYADRFVLTLINNRIIKKSDFDEKENGVTLLNDNGRKIFLNNW